MGVLTVYYDGACPLCVREIAFYRNRPGSEHINWHDVSGYHCGEIVPGLTAEKAKARFHVTTRNGRLVQGGAAFAELWAQLPGLRWIGRVMRVPPFVWILNGAYRLFLPVRPILQRFARRRFGDPCTVCERD